jgi:hypothetical protein
VLLRRKSDLCNFHRYLLIEFDAAECSGWTLVLATLLFRVNSVLDVLEQHPAYWKVYKATLMKQQWSVALGIVGFWYFWS